MRRNHVGLLFSLAVVSAPGVHTALAQSFPVKPIRLITSNAGTTSDIIARLVGQTITKPMGQPVIIDNRPAGVIPGQAVAEAAPDGYTILYDGSGFWLRHLLQKTPYDPVRDFLPITQAIRQPALLVVHPALPVKTARDLITLAKTRPGDLNYATGSTGSLTHLAAELFQAMSGVKLVRVNYKGGPQAVTDLIAGEVQVLFGVMTLVGTQVKAGKLKALAVTSAQPTSLAPGMVTLAASGLPGYESVSNGGFFAPARTPRVLVDRFNQEIVRALFGPELKDKLLVAGAEPVGGSPEQFDAAVKSEIAQINKLIKDRGITAE